MLFCSMFAIEPDSINSYGCSGLTKVNCVKLNDLDLFVFTELTNTMKYRGGGSYNSQAGAG